MLRLTLISVLVFFSTLVRAGGIKGIVTDATGERMAFTSVIVKGQNAGTMTNAEGEYRINLKPGSYEINFQFVGFKTVTRRVVVANDFTELNVRMQEQTIMLQEARISAKEEDAAYTIMRKAIAKSKIHQKQVVSYQANAYVRNSILLNKIPLVLKKDLYRQNIKEGIPFLSESVMEIVFNEPNSKFTKVLGQKSSFNNISISDGFYLFDFYDPGHYRVSPLSPQAFRYYRFEYEGFFEDRGLIINKIKIIPKSFGEGVWQGTIYIIDDYWNIHSIDAETIENGLNLKINQYYSPVEKVWMPINQRIDFYGKLFGFDFVIKAQLNAGYTAVKTNPAFVEDIKIIDEKKEGITIEGISKNSLKNSKTEELLKDSKEFSVKNLMKIMKDYEKEERARARANKEEAAVVSRELMIVEPSARSKDSTFWNSMRKIPLTNEESESYQYSDSVKIAKIEKRDSLQRDSLSKAWRYFLLNYDFKLKNGRYLHFEPPYTPFVGLNYNSVEGIVSDMGIGFKNYTSLGAKPRVRYNVSANMRYAFQARALRGKVGGEYEVGTSKLSVGAGNYIEQFDPNSLIFEWMNTVTTLFNEQNLMKIYSKKFVNIGYSYNEDARLTFSTNMELARRSPLENLQKIYRIKDFEKNGFSPNNPSNLELGESAFTTHNALIWQNMIKWTPSSKVIIRNGVRKYLTGGAPIITFIYKKGMLDANFDYLSLNIKQHVNTGVLGKLDYMIEVGDYVNDRSVYLMDMKHINNSYLNALRIGLFARYRLLETRMPLPEDNGAKSINLYRFSTKGAYLQAHVINEFKQLIFTRLPFVKRWGLKEDLFANYLNTPAVKNYIEVGYGIDGIMRALRIEAVSSFENGIYKRAGIKLGVTM
ncbi:DUF5686 and carboxypeptidase regulatory-like domain-containing protein [Emticicia fluvialis]|uniref:DUF5686 and carboxypeptidase regulatory-like domain-containing protein n=1 Tax=Emticicia fluvialis TaxID=2974474 RepID=UPI002165C4E6|nr:DUF5686 and carboxypeptidase regulatory-like domain-containing protein [Emticicia fluvialis]